ncbi:HNH endonuclease family protein [Couchioplanes azureus]|uniref:HNH endonuclease family protein n=1 Tax=Couchioplanes caeruleus TaxID=56438 RepID=UPI001670F8F5|nr:HNH endonuclease family protein [Couchioplanes caeruleus]GGQ85871.1 hypothetical protein GCM10010166_65060 [Couchioplanes caeruleus subsp. azureus]
MSRTPRWTARLTALIAVITGLTVILPPATAGAEPPGIPSDSTALAQLDALTVAEEGPMDGYSRQSFRHWITISGKCDTRETVLKRDGDSVVTGTNCAATEGSWYSPYDGETWTDASDLDIDHVVPLAEAWRSGADSWTASRRQAFANDLSRPQLIPVTNNVNRSKGDEDPSTWQPSVSSYRCTYAKMWIAVKYYWSLTLQSEEKDALEDMLSTCGS